MTSSSDAAIVKALVSMSRDLGLDTIAEGIETPEQEASLKAMGCPAGQGYRYARPMPEADVGSYLFDVKSRLRA